jgi:hypothetical protein
MKISLSLFAALCLPLLAVAGPETLERCEPQMKSWLPPGGTQNACRQFASNAGIGAANYNNSHQVAAFTKDGVLVGIRNLDRGQEDPSLKQTFNPAKWEDVGSAGTVGELWWGRQDDMHIFVGQESSIRLSVAYSRGPMPSQQEMQGRIQAMMAAAKAKANNQPVPQSAYDNPLFIKRSVDYSQIGGTNATFRGGLGGDGYIPPGRIKNARLRLDKLPEYRGTLSFVMNVDGVERNFSFPVMPDPNTGKLIAAWAEGDNYSTCEKRPKNRNDDLSCPLNKENFVERYNAEGSFFGDHAALAAVKVYMTVNSPSRNRHSDIAVAVIVLKADQAASTVQR